MQIVLCRPVGVVPAVFVHDVDLAFGCDHGRVLGKGFGFSDFAKLKNRLPVGIIFSGDNVGSFKVEHGAALVEQEQPVVVLVQMFFVDGLDVHPDGVDPLGNRRKARSRPGHHAYQAAHIAVFPGHDRRIILKRNARQRALVVQQRGNVLLKHGDELGVGKKVVHVFVAGPLRILADTGVDACGAVAHEREDEPEAAVVRSFHGIIDVRERFGIELARLGLMQSSQPTLSPMVCERTTRAPIALAVSSASSTS